jgi:hypothetical protein
MRKVLFSGKSGAPVCAAFLIISSFLAIIPAGTAYAAPAVSAGSITLILPSGPYAISKDKNGLDFIQMEGFSQSALPGDPMLPHRVFDVLVPPDVVWQSINLRIASADTLMLDGTYDIKPASQVAHTYDSTVQPEQGQGENYELVNGRNVNVYGTDADFPAAYLALLPYSQMRKWNFTRVDLTPFRYNPVSKKLTLVKSVTLEISYQRSGIAPAAGLMADSAMDSAASQMLFNYRQAGTEYPELSVPRAQAAMYDYVIITTSAIQAGSAKLASFVAHKQSRGYNVLVVNETVWGAVTGQSPNSKADKIRKWLQQNYISYGIQNVLLIGNPSPYESGEGDVPMKMCWPRNNQTWETGYKNAPTDYYYADLTGNWDLDADGYYGEYPHDTAPGGVDLSPEVYVGRIPVYGADYASMDSILQKIIDYENEGNTAWRKSALLPMSFSDSSTDGAYLSEKMKTNYLNAAGYSSWRMYQQGSDCPAANSSFTSEEELRSGLYVRDRWAANDFGIVSWWGHGNGTGAYSGYSGCGSGAFFTSPYCSVLDDDHPSFTFQGSCTNGQPEAGNNLQYSILRQGGIGTVGATRVSWYGPGETSFVDSPSNAGIGYEYVKRLVAGNTAGNALYSTMQSVVSVNDPEFLMNAFDFNLYGDPTVKIISGTPTALPAPTLLSPNNGAVISTLPPTLDWSDPAGANSYGVQVSAASSFAAMLVNQSALGASTYTVPCELGWNTLYYWRANAANETGNSVWSATGSFITPAGPPPNAADNLIASAVSSTRLNLKWDDNSDIEMGFKIERKTGAAAYAQIAQVGPGVTSYSNTTGLVTGRQYFYRVKAYYASGSSAYSNEAEATTLPPPPTVPTPVLPTSGFTVPTLIPVLDWSDPVGATSYSLQVSTASNFATTVLSQTGLVSSTATVPAGTLAWNKTYYWKANAANGYGSTSNWSAARTFKTALGPPPLAPSGLNANAISSTRIDVTWADNSDNEAGFKIERKKTGSTFAQVATVVAGVTNYNNTTGLTANMQYIYRVRAYLGTTLNSAYSDEALATTLPLPPAVPTLVSPGSGAVVSSLTPVLNWKAVSGASSYAAQVSATISFAIPMASDTSGLPAASGTVTAPLAWNTTYYWRVRAINALGLPSAWSAARTFKTALGLPPLAPSGLTATAASSSQINVAWVDNSNNETGFRIERKKVGGAFAQVATVLAGVTTYSNTTGLTVNTEYYYRVRAYLGTTLNSAYSDEASATTLPPPPAASTLVLPSNGGTVPTLTPALEWKAPAGAVLFGVQVSTVSTFTSTVVNQSGLGAPAYTVPGETLALNALYYWRANSTNASGSTSAWSAVRTFRTVP